MRALFPIALLAVTLGCFPQPIPPGPGFEGEGEGEGEGEVPADQCVARALFPNVDGSGLVLSDGFAQEDTQDATCINNGNDATAVGIVAAIVSPPYEIVVDNVGNLIGGQIAVAVEGDAGARFADLGQIAVSESDFQTPCNGEERCLVAAAICIPPGASPLAMQLFDAASDTSNALCLAVTQVPDGG